MVAEALTSVAGLHLRRGNVCLGPAVRVVRPDVGMVRRGEWKDVASSGQKHWCREHILVVAAVTSQSRVVRGEYGPSTPDGWRTFEPQTEASGLYAHSESQKTERNLVGRNLRRKRTQYQANPLRAPHFERTS